MRKLALHPHERCTCPRSKSSGRSYFKRFACMHCNRFIVGLIEGDFLKAREEKLAAADRHRDRMEAAVA